MVEPRNIVTEEQMLSDIKAICVTRFNTWKSSYKKAASLSGIENEQLAHLLMNTIDLQVNILMHTQLYLESHKTSDQEGPLDFNMSL